MKKLIGLFLLTVFTWLPSYAAKIAVTVGNGTLQPGTTAGFNVSSGTVANFKFANANSTGVFTLNGATMTSTNALQSGTIIDTSTRTYRGGVSNGIKVDNSSTTYTGVQTFKNGIVVSTGTLGLFVIGQSSASINEPAYIMGTTTNDSAAVGYYGEYTSSSSAGVVNFPTSGQWGNTLSISLTPGDWDITYNLDTIPGSASMTAGNSGIGTVTGNDSTGVVNPTTAVNLNVPPTTVSAASTVFPRARTSISSTTTYFLKVNATYTVATPQYRGLISARRVR